MFGDHPSEWLTSAVNWLDIERYPLRFYGISLLVAYVAARIAEGGVL